MKKLLSILAITFSLTTYADTSVGLHITSLHDTGNFNNDTKGIFVKQDSYVLGTYFNSINKQSIYIAKDSELFSNVSITYGIITGYKNDVLPLIAPSIKYTIDKYEVRLFILPNIVDITDATVASLTVSYTWK